MNSYVDGDVLYSYPDATDTVCKLLAERVSGIPIDVVVGLSSSSVAIAQSTALHLRKTPGSKTLSIYAQKTTSFDHVFFNKLGLKLVLRRKVLVVNDVIGKTDRGEKVSQMKMLVNAVNAAGGTVVAAGAIINHGGVARRELGDVPELFTLASVPLEIWSAAQCPLCAKRMPVNVEVSRGRGTEFVEKQMKQGPRQK
jgi:orotate phosphoribosyltransferase